MRRVIKQREDGQTLVYVALGLVVLLMITALAIDGGHLYAERRRMQNAADAGALAGARELCLGRTQAQAEAAAVQYATTQQSRPYGHTATASANMGTSVITVTTNETPALFLAGALGLGSANVGATAKAACGPAKKACGLFPLAFDLSQWNKVKDTCGKPFYVWDGDDDTGPDCNVCNCNTPGGEIFPGLGRAWLDMSSGVNPLYPTVCKKSGCGADEIKCWIADPNPAPITIPSCISGDTGVKAGVKKQIDDRAGDIVQVPLFNSLCAGSTCSGGFNITSLGCVQVIGWEQKLQLYEIADPTEKCWAGKVVKVSVSCDRAACQNKCGSTTGGGCTGGSDVCSVSLIP